MLTRTLGVIRFSTQQRIQERFASGLVTSTMRFDRNKNSVESHRVVSDRPGAEPSDGSFHYPCTKRRDSLRDSSRPDSASRCPQTWKVLAFFTPGS